MSGVHVPDSMKSKIETFQDVLNSSMLNDELEFTYLVRERLSAEYYVLKYKNSNEELFYLNTNQNAFRHNLKNSSDPYDGLQDDLLSLVSKQLPTIEFLTSLIQNPLFVEAIIKKKFS